MDKQVGYEDRVKKLPIKVSRKDFNEYILPHLSKARRGPPGKLSLYQIFNYILFVLHTGIQWNQLPVKRNALHWSNIYKWHWRWSMDGSYRDLFEASVMQLSHDNKLDLTTLHGDGSNTVAKKGEVESVTRDTNIRREKKS